MTRKVSYFRKGEHYCKLRVNSIIEGPSYTLFENV